MTKFGDDGHERRTILHDPQALQIWFYGIFGDNGPKITNQSFNLPKQHFKTKLQGL